MVAYYNIANENETLKFIDKAVEYYNKSSSYAAISGNNEMINKI